MVSGRPGPASTSGHLTLCAHQKQTRHRPTAAAQTTTAAAARRQRHRPRLLPPWRRQSCAGARCACRLHLLLCCSHAACVACACACGFGCGPRPLLHRCPLRTEKRKLPELTCELGLSPPGARTRAEPRDKVHHSDARRRRRKLCTKT